jgi:hypothetical protein
VENFTAADGPKIKATGVPMKKKPNPVYLLKQAEPFTVDSPEGRMSGNAGDFVAHDPLSGHVWSVLASYVAQHYEPT